MSIHPTKVRKRLDTKELVTILIVVSPDGRRLAAYGFREEKDKTSEGILPWDAKTGEWKQTLTCQEPSKWILCQTMWIPSIAFSPNGRSLAIARMTDADGRVKDGEKTKGELWIVPLGR